MSVVSRTAEHVADSPTELDVSRKVAARLIPLIIVCYLFAYFDRINISFAKFQMQSDLGYSNAAYGFGASIFFLGYVLFELPSNMMLHRVGARLWIARIMITWGMATSAMVFIHSTTSFYLLRFLIGALEAGFAPGVLYYFTRWFPASYRGRINGLFFLSITLAGVFGAPAAGWVLGHFNGVGGLASWQWLFIAGGVPCILLGLLVLRWLQDRIEDASWLTAPEKNTLLHAVEKSSRNVSGHSLRLAIRHPAFIILGLIYFTVQIGSYGLNFWLPHMIKVSGATDPFHIGLITAIPYFSAAIGMIVIGRLSDRSGERRLYLAGCLAAAALGFFASTAWSGSTVPLMVALTVAGTGVMVAIPMFWTLPPRFTVGAGAAGGIALINSLGQLGGVVSPYMVGKITDVTGSTKLGVLVIATLCTIGMILVLLALPADLRGKDPIVPDG